MFIIMIIMIVIMIIMIIIMIMSMMIMIIMIMIIIIIIITLQIESCGDVCLLQQLCMENVDILIVSSISPFLNAD